MRENGGFIHARLCKDNPSRIARMYLIHVLGAVFTRRVQRPLVSYLESIVSYLESIASYLESIASYLLPLVLVSMLLVSEHACSHL